MGMTFIADSIPTWSARAPKGGETNAPIANERPKMSDEAVPECCGAAFCARTMFMGIEENSKALEQRRNRSETIPDV